jgi:hypothetical protein
MLICGLSGRDETGADHYLNLQRLTEGGDPDDDWGVHLGVDDQRNGGYGCVAACRLTRGELAIDLSRQIGGMIGVRGIDVALLIDDDSYENVRAGLQRVFRGMTGVLQLA